jgi:hypothetical protein
MTKIAVSMLLAFVLATSASADTATAARARTATSAAPESTAPPGDPAALLTLVLALDRRMFEAFDAHDVDRLMSWFAPELEFFHDTGGLSDWTQTKQGFVRLFAQNADIRRELVPGSTRVYPVKDYGAIQIGRHTFCHTENGANDCGTFEFVQVWRWHAGRWQVTRELSYGH